MSLTSVIIGQCAVGSGQWAVINVQWAAGSDQWAAINVQWAAINVQWTASTGQWSMCSGQRAVGSEQCAVISGQQAVCSNQCAVGSDQCAVGSDQWVASSGQWSMCSGQWSVDSDQWANSALLARHSVQFPLDILLACVSVIQHTLFEQRMTFYYICYTFFDNEHQSVQLSQWIMKHFCFLSFLSFYLLKNPVVKKSLSCLKDSISDLTNTYTTALLAYVFTLAGDMETRAHLLQLLDTAAKKEGESLYWWKSLSFHSSEFNLRWLCALLFLGGVLHWSQTATETSASLSVEISSYVLMAKLSVSHTAEDLGYASSIVRWLTQQQNYRGGFSSTQVLFYFSKNGLFS